MDYEDGLLIIEMDKLSAVVSTIRSWGNERWGCLTCLSNRKRNHSKRRSQPAGEVAAGDPTHERNVAGAPKGPNVNFRRRESSQQSCCIDLEASLSQNPRA
jgi:hypothetical protein